MQDRLSSVAKLIVCCDPSSPPHPVGKSVRATSGQMVHSRDMLSP